MTDDNQDIVTEKDHELFLDIARDIRKNSARYREAGNWLNEYCSEDAHWQRQKTKLEELQRKEKEYSVLGNIQRVKQLEEKIKEKRTPVLARRFQEAREYLLKKYEDQQFVPEDDARRFILIVWLLTDPDAEKANVNITELEKWPWEPIDDMSPMSRGYAQLLFFHGGRNYRPLMRLVRIAWAKLCAEEEYKVDSMQNQDKKGDLVKNFMDNLLRTSVKHFPFCGSFLYDVIYGTIDNQKSGIETKVQHEVSKQRQISKVGKKTNGEKEYIDKWFQNRTIQAALISSGVLLLVSIVGWLIFLHINKSKTSQDQPESVVTENRLLLSLREICQDIDNRPLVQKEDTASHYTGMFIEKEPLQLYEIVEIDETSKVDLLFLFPGEPFQLGPVGWKIYANVDADLYPFLKTAKRNLQLTVSGRIEHAYISMIELSDVSLEIDADQ